MGSAPGPRPLFCKKAGQKTFTGPDFRQPKPLAPGASDKIRPRSGHLSGRVAAPTRVGEAGGSRNLTGAPPPHKRFSLGLHPVSLGKTKEMGWNRQTKVKTTNSKTASSAQPKPTPRAALEPRPYRRSQRAFSPQIEFHPAFIGSYGGSPPAETALPALRRAFSRSRRSRSSSERSFSSSVSFSAASRRRRCSA